MTAPRCQPDSDSRPPLVIGSQPPFRPVAFKDMTLTEFQPRNVRKLIYKTHATRTRGRR